VFRPASSARQPTRAPVAATIDGMIEGYDFYTYATTAALAFSKLHFPSQRNAMIAPADLSSTIVTP
jgi:hypothetical protein